LLRDLILQMLTALLLHSLLTMTSRHLLELQSQASKKKESVETSQQSLRTTSTKIHSHSQIVHTSTMAQPSMLMVY